MIVDTVRKRRNAESSRRYRERHKNVPETPRQRELRLAAAKRYYDKKVSTEEGRDKFRDYSRRYRESHPEQTKAATKRWRESHRDEWNISRRDWRKRNKLSRLFYEARRRAAQRDIEFTIELSDIPPMGDVCPIFGLPFTDDYTLRPSIDRINPKLGYVPGNVWIIGYRANLIKNDGTAEEHELIAKAMRRKRRVLLERD